MSYFEAWRLTAEHWASIKGRIGERRYKALDNMSPETKCAACSIVFVEHGYDARTLHWFVPPIKETT